MSGRAINLASREVAATERERLDTLLDAVNKARLATAAAQNDAMSEAAEFIALQALIKAEEGLVALALDPALAAFLACIRDQLADIAGEAA